MNLLIAFMIACAPFTSGNEGSAVCQFSGKVCDAQNAETLAGAVVKIVELNKTAYCDFNGRFLLPDVPPGRYTLQISQPGYEKLVIKELELSGKSEFLPLHLSGI